MPLVELSERQVQMVIESLAYSKLSKSGGAAPNELKQKELADIDQILTQLRVEIRE